jgi:hypothetical protein
MSKGSQVKRIPPALKKTVVGGCLSIVVFVLFFFAKQFFPELSEIGLDMGARVLASKERLVHLGTGLPPANAADGYTFLDVDPEDLSYAGAPTASLLAPSQQVCDAAVAAGKVPGPLACPATRSLNRRLLGAIVRALQDRGASMIVLDIALSRDSESDAERTGDVELSTAMCASEIPLIYASGAPLVQRNDETVQALIQVEGPPDLVTDCGGKTSLVAAAVALPVGEHPIRRFPRCYRVTDAGGTHLSASLPYLAAQSLALGRIADAAKLCAAVSDGPDADEPRIVYTLPPVPGHALSDTAYEGGSDRSFYQRVYKRCRADAFWDGRTTCGTETAFKGRVVVIGASSAERHDRHYTALGEMAGPQLVVNAMRSFALHPEAAEQSYWPLLGDFLFLLVGCVVWWAVRYWRQRSEAKSDPPVTWGWFKVFRIWLATVLLLLVVGTLAWPYYLFGGKLSLDLLVPLLASGIEIYTEVAASLTEWLEASLERWFSDGGSAPLGSSSESAQPTLAKEIPSETS